MGEAPLLAQSSADSGKQTLNDNYLEVIFTRVTDPREATQAFYDALEHLGNPSPENENRLARLCADITDIINEAESKKWKTLKTAEEKIFFLKRFWLGRDLTPATVTNERLVEHYKRLLHARARYSYFDFRGYDDRGIIYVQYGPPDNSVEDVFESNTYPVSSWVYYRFGHPVNFDFINKGPGYRFNSRLADALVVKNYESLLELMRRRIDLCPSYTRLYLQLQQGSGIGRALNEFMSETAKNQAELPKAASEVSSGFDKLPCEVKFVQFEGSNHASDLVVIYGFKKADIKRKTDTVHVQIATALRDTTLGIWASQNMTYPITLDTSQSSEEFVGVDIYSLPTNKYYLN